MEIFNSYFRFRRCGIGGSQTCGIETSDAGSSSRGTGVVQTAKYLPVESRQSTLPSRRIPLSAVQLPHQQHRRSLSTHQGALALDFHYWNFH